jgi:hypothetical protein
LSEHVTNNKTNEPNAHKSTSIKDHLIDGKYVNMVMTLHIRLHKNRLTQQHHLCHKNIWVLRNYLLPKFSVNLALIAYSKPKDIDAVAFCLSVNFYDDYLMNLIQMAQKHRFYTPINSETADSG